MRFVQVAALGVVAVVALTGLWVGVLSPIFSSRAGDGIGQGEYALDTTEGTTFTAASLKGQATAVFFGFTHCPDVCPTTLGDMMGWQDALGDQAKDLRIVFVTVDPERDTVDLLRDYVGWLPGAIGATGAVDQVRAAEAAFRVFSQKEPLANGDYTMSHTSKVLVFNRSGAFVDAISYQEAPETAVAKLETALSS
ncbi:SCO family protein [Falsirhodobacter sp. 20TX0035]|uniref:SCO family protein n=1 Tax=Falsirhodobacter sp. 20TX0035 TaxID=3022019 RepID=UPI00232BC080|nr:SCO family protein [Falsirhodobacter sp. 20TX0035]MDB6453629.1 SCO family protein [Falsirhodobacter sp. 20TX0035]